MKSYAFGNRTDHVGQHIVVIVYEKLHQNVDRSQLEEVSQVLLDCCYSQCCLTYIIKLLDILVGCGTFPYGTGGCSHQRFLITHIFVFDYGDQRL